MASKVEPLDAAVIQRTRDTLGKIIAKPPLTDKLLSRPPFRYLHDIVTEVMRTTGFLEGLYSAEELNVSNIQDKEQKLKFLQKAVDAVMFTTGETLKVRASKVIAGQECERTNEFLQAMATAILSKLDSSEAVQQVLKGEKPSDSIGKGGKKKPRADKRAPEEGAAKEPKVARRSSKVQQEEGGDAPEKDKQRGSKEKKGISSSDLSQSNIAADRQPRDKSKDRSDKERRHRERRKEKEVRGSEQAGQGEVDPGGGEESAGQEGELPTDGPTGDSLASVPLRPPSAKGGRKRQSSNEGANQAALDGEAEGGTQQQLPPQGRAAERPVRQVEEDGVKEEPGAQVGMTQEDEEDHPSTPPLPPMAIASQMRRPGSSRPAPPRVLRHQISQEPSAGVGGGVSSGGGAVARVILDTDKGDEEDDGNFITEEVPVVDAMNQLPVATEDIDRLAVGALARTMIETKERLEGEMAPQSKEQGGPRISEAERRKQRELVAKEIEKLQSGIQALCRSTTPLGKIVDYVQEDIESMQKELEGWRKENADHTDALRREESITDQELQPLRMQLSELEARIVEQNELILAAKVNILQNDEKIQQMLQNMSFSVTT